MTDVIDNAGLPDAIGATAPPASAAEKLSFRTKTIYGSGALVEVTINTVLGAFHLLYLTAVCGLSGTLAGASAFAALAVDACVDPFVGSWSDNTHSRFGRRHPFMFASALPIAISFGLLFTIPPSFKGTTLFLYSTGVLLCMRFGLSAWVVPYMAMGGELTDDYHERSVVVAYRHFFGILAGIVPLLLGLPFFLRGGNDLVRAAYIPYAWTCAAIVLGGAALSAFGSLDQVPHLHQAPHGVRKSMREFVGEIAEVFRNRSFNILFGALLIFFIAQGAAGALALHAQKFFWQFPSGVIATNQVAIPVGSAIGIPIITLIALKLEKRTIVLAGQFAFCTIQLMLPLLRIWGLLPPNGPALYAILAANSIFAGIIVTALVIGFQSMMADAADEHDFLFGSRREGLYFAGLSFSVKMTAAVGVLISGIALDAIGFPTAWISAHPQMPVHLAPDVIRNLGLIAGPMPAAITFLCIVITWFYRLDRKRHAEIRAVLSERRSRGGANAPAGVKRSPQ